jgi:hypothetical protein
MPASFPCLAGHVGLASHLYLARESRATVELSQLRGAGVKWVREDFPWALTEPEPGVYDWSKTDSLMAAAAKAGVNVLGIIDYSASWASSDPTGQGDQFYPPSNPDDYAQYARAVILRYGERGTFWTQHPELARRPLRAVELWNEPYAFWYWKPNPDPATYARLVHAAAAAIKRARPDTTVLISGDAFQRLANGEILSWLDQVLSADRKLAHLIDAYGVHPYPDPRNRPPSDNGWIAGSFSRVALTERIAARHDAARPIWITEVGWSTAEPAVGGVSESQQANYIRSAVMEAFSRWAVVRRMFIYSWDESSGGGSSWDGNLALRREDGSPKPAWNALVNLLSKNRRKCSRLRAARSALRRDARPKVKG